MGFGVKEGVMSEFKKVSDAACRPHIALKGILLIVELLGGCVKKRADIERQCLDLGHVHLLNPSCTAKVPNLYYAALSD